MDFSEGEFGSFGGFVLIPFRASGGNRNDEKVSFYPWFCRFCKTMLPFWPCKTMLPIVGTQKYILVFRDFQLILQSEAQRCSTLPFAGNKLSTSQVDGCEKSEGVVDTIPVECQLLVAIVPQAEGS